MIKTIIAGPGLVASGSIYQPYVNISAPSAGLVRYNNNNIEVYDGSSWLPLTTTTTIDFDYATREVLDWAKEQMRKEKAIEKLKDNPAIADLLKQKADIDDKIKMVEILLRGNNESDPR